MGYVIQNQISPDFGFPEVGISVKDGYRHLMEQSHKTKTFSHVSLVHTYLAFLWLNSMI